LGQEINPLAVTGLATLLAFRAHNVLLYSSWTLDFVHITISWKILLQDLHLLSFSLPLIGRHVFASYILKLFGEQRLPSTYIVNYFAFICMLY
jgi:hypothetical protein